MTKLIGLTSSEIVPDNTLLRVTFGERHSILPDSLFQSGMARVFDQLAPAAKLIPLQRNTLLPGAVVATVDVMNHTPRTTAQLAQLLDMAGGSYAELLSIEKLAGQQRVDATKPAGAAAREAVAQTAAAAAAQDDAWHKLFSGLGIAADAVKWLGIAVVLLVVWYFMPKKS